MDNIILIGMPGSGKSTVGVLLAKLVGYRFLDTDLLIQQQAGKRLYQILEEDGPAAFAQLENEVNRSIDTDHTVIATGGSVIFGKEAMAHLKAIGQVVYLEVDLPTLQKRVGDFSRRGILMEDGQTLSDIYRERTPLYAAQADLTVSCGGEDLAANAFRIADALGRNT
ncbi:MAG: shikimate kinase [Oscillospiraceae bacterium]|nr:shikimate kinase [Oscillospiraceae bacterium]